MSKSWTNKQRLAIEAEGKTLLVSAAAGSGKTATLTERIVRRLTDPTSPKSISRMLVVTFTRMSAADLRRKISNAISEELARDPSNQHLSKQLVLLESASICTIDSFYLDIVRSNFQRLSLPSDFRLADEGEMALLRKEVMDSVIERHYDANEDDGGAFLRFVEHFTSAKQSDTLSDIFLSLETRLCSSTDGTGTVARFAKALRAQANGEFFNSTQGAIIKEHMLDAARHYHGALVKCCDYIAANEKAMRAYFAAFAYEKDFFAGLLESIECGSYEAVKRKLESFGKQKLGALKREYQTDEIALCKALRDEETKFIKSATEKYFSFSADEIRAVMLRTADVLDSLHAVLEEFERDSLAEKIRRRAFEFDDIRRFAYQLLTDADGAPSDIALSYREKFDEIYIDEYQDVDAVQDRIFSLISNGRNRFMVGDIKQSIYSFRGADPSVFARYKTTFPSLESSENSDEALIFMSNNFRCDENVIKFTNKVFEFLFGHCGKSIGYDREDDLIFSKIEEGRTLPSPEVTVAVITGDESSSEDEEAADEVDNDPNPEAKWIASEVSRLIREEKKADGTPIEPRDIAIIMRSTTPASDIARALAMHSIPSADNSKYDLFETPDVLLVISLLSTIDNPHRDIPLAATLYSPVFGYTMDELIEIRKSADASMSLFEALISYGGQNAELMLKNTRFKSSLERYRSMSLSLPIDGLLECLYRELSLHSLAVGDSQNLTRLYEMARRFESSSFKGLNNFISYINELIENKKVPALSAEDSNINAVRLITAHKSKGLEFPVCFICNAQGNFNLEDVKPNLLYHPTAGIALALALEGGMARLNTPIREAVALEITNAQIEEEMRVLYVALTRARERLYVTAHTRSRLERLEENARIASTFASDFKLKKCRNYLAMILAAIDPIRDGNGDGDDDGYRFIACSQDSVSSAAAEIRPCDMCADTAESKAEIDVEKIAQRINFEYPWEHVSRLPAKLSVSKLTPTVLDDIDNDAATLESFDEARILEIEEFFESKSGISGADRGTATHLFLQFCDFDNAEKSGVREELARLTEKRFISPAIAELINIRQIEKFFASEFYKALKGAKRTYREQRFNILLPATHFTKNENFRADLDGEEILVQGVIDLFFEDENGKIILCDYKTDYLSPEEQNDGALVAAKMKARHGKQLEYYAMAVERFLDRMPDRILIYSLPFGEAVEIEL